MSSDNIQTFYLFAKAVIQNAMLNYKSVQGHQLFQKE